MNFRRFVFAGLVVAMLAAGAAKAATTINFTDQWWIPAESGWGAAVLQQGGTLFIDLFVYGADGKATWFVAAATNQPGAAPGHVVFTGDLYTASGPYYGGDFGAAPVVGRKVGTLTFDAGGIATATLSYTVDGTPVVKNVSRQFLAFENFGGNYTGAWLFDLGSCASPADNDHVDAQITVQFTHRADNTVTLVIQDNENNAFTLNGTYGQVGHLGYMTTTFAPPMAGTMTFTELERSTAGFVGRFTGAVQSPIACTISGGRIAGARLPVAAAR